MNGLSAPVRVLLIILLFPAMAFSQDESWNPRYSLSLSVNYSQIRDENVAPVSFSGPGVGGTIRRWYDGNFFYQYIEAGGYVVLPKSAKEQSARSAMGSAAIKYGFNLKRAFGSEHVSVGVFALASLREAYYKNYKSNNLYWANFIGLGGNFTLEEPLSEKYAFQLIVDIPLAGIDFRPDLNRKPALKNTVKYVLNSNFSNSNFAMPGNYLNPSFTLGILTSNRSGLRGVSYRYTHVKAKTTISGEYRENDHSLVLTFKLFN